jgi:hypothetical protein
MLNKEIIGKRIAFFRREKGITQREHNIRQLR